MALRPSECHPTDQDLSAGKAGLFRSGAFYSILILAMRKRKPEKFSATKAVKANARERVGQPKPARVIDTEPRTGREAKHKPKLDEIIHQEE
ncbi:MAG: hypothetical protein ABR912_15635 [Terracidiphilus sp.]|jgi:hypothetical protein